MVVFFFGNYVCFCGECLKAFVSQCKGEGANIAAVQRDGLSKLVLPCEQNVVVLGDAGVAVTTPLLFRHGLLHLMLWGEQPDLTIWDVVQVRMMWSWTMPWSSSQLHLIVLTWTFNALPPKSLD